VIPGLDPRLRAVIRMRVYGSYREAARKLSTPGGVLALALGVVLLGGPFAVRALLPGMSSPESVAQWGPTSVLALWLVQVLLRGGGDVLGFEPSEADQLFAAPVPSSQLMRYKLGLLAIAWSNGAILLTPVAAMYATTLLGAFFAALLVLPFLQMSAMVMTLVREGAGVPPWVRFVALTGLVFTPAMLAGGVGTGVQAVADGVNGLLQHPVGAVVLAPFAAASRLMGSGAYGEVLASAAVLAGVNALLMLSLLTLGQRSWVEHAQSGADTMRARMASYRSDGLSGASGWIRVPVPRVALGGFGGVFWRRTAELVRRPATWVGLGGVAMLTLMLALVAGRGRVAVLAMIGAVLVWGTVMLPSVLRSDFRGDLDRIDALRAMPVRTVSLFLGNVLPMALLLGLFEALVCFALVLWQPAVAREGLAAMVAAPVWSVLVVTSENTIFLFLPARMEAGEAAIGSVGRNLMSTMLGWMAHGSATTLALAVGIAGGVLLQGFWVGVGLGLGTMLGLTALIAGVGTWKLARFTPPLT